MLTAWSHSGHTTCASTVSWPEGSLLACAVTCGSCPCPSDVLSRALFVLFSVHRSALVLMLAQAAPGRLGGAHPILCLHDTCGCTEVQSHDPPRAHCHPRPGAVSCVELRDRQMFPKGTMSIVLSLYKKRGRALPSFRLCLPLVSRLRAAHTVVRVCLPVGVCDAAVGLAPSQTSAFVLGNGLLEHSRKACECVEPQLLGLPWH